MEGMRHSFGLIQDESQNDENAFICRAFPTLINLLFFGQYDTMILIDF